MIAVSPLFHSHGWIFFCDRKYAIDFGNRYSKPKKKRDRKMSDQYSEDAVVIGEAGAGSTIPLIAGNTREQDLLLDNVEDGVFSLEHRHLKIDVKEEREFKALFADTPRPRHIDLFADERPVAEFCENPAAAALKRFQDPLKRTRPPLPKTSTSFFKIKYGTDTAVKDELTKELLSTPVLEESGLHETTVVSPVQRSDTDAESTGSGSSSGTGTAPSGGNPWVQLFSKKHKRLYWFNNDSGASQWTPP